MVQPSTSDAATVRSLRGRVRAGGGAAVVALVAGLGVSACLPPPPVTTCSPVGAVPDPIQFQDLGALSHALEARFPTCFGGVVRTGDHSADLYVIGQDPAVLLLAEQLIGPGFAFTERASDHALADVRLLKQQIDADADDLHAAGIPTQATGIKIVAAGPRVLVGIWPDSAEARAGLEERYGADWLLIIAYEYHDD
jgi:hypothetical protein